MPARRARNGYRAYGEEDLRLLAQIRTLQDFGFGLEETRPIVECLRAGHPEGDSCPASLEVYRRKLAELDDCIARLREVREQVGARLGRTRRWKPRSGRPASRSPGANGLGAQTATDGKRSEMAQAVTVAEVTDATFAGEVLEAGGPVLVEFTASWCPPCRMVAPVLEAVAQEQSGRLKVVQVDVDANPETAAAYGVLSMPMLIVFSAGQPVTSMVGACPKRRLLRELDDVLR